MKLCQNTLGAVKNALRLAIETEQRLEHDAELTALSAPTPALCAHFTREAARHYRSWQALAVYRDSITETCAGKWEHWAVG